MKEKLKNLDKIYKIIAGILIFGVLSLFITVPIAATFPNTYLFCIFFYVILVTIPIILAVIEEIQDAKDDKNN